MIRIETRSQSPDRSGAARQFETDFSQLPAQVRKDPYRSALTPAPITLQMMQLPLGKPVEFFLAWGDSADSTKCPFGRPLGRMGANVDSSGTRGYVGFFEVDLESPLAGEVAKALLQAAQGWLLTHGVKQILGPLDYSTWFSYRFQLENKLDDRTPSFAWEPVNPPEYPAFFKSFGMTEVQRYHSQAFSSVNPELPLPNTENLKNAHDYALSQGFRFRPIELSKLAEREIPLLHQLSHQGFKDAFLFESISLSVFAALYAQALQRFDFSPSQFVETADGRTAGFLFAFVDGDYLVIKTIAVLEEYQNMKLSSALLYPAFDFCFKNRIGRGISALIKSGAKSEHHEKRNQQLMDRDWIHEYSLFGKDVS